MINHLNNEFGSENCITRFKSYAIFLGLLLSLFMSSILLANTPWDGDHFPNTELINQDGKTFRFYDDLVKGKIVVINFIYTSCPDVCPLETAQLTRVQRIMGDRLGKDVFFYSISIDPKTDTPEVLKEYRSRFGAKWNFFTGDENEIIEIRRKLGLYVEDLGGSDNNHNVNMIIGNQTTGRWMKRSPFENPYVLADQIGNWLTGWKSPQKIKNYANAPELDNISDGENLFRTRCMSCHTINGSDEKSIGPDLLNVINTRDRQWLIRWLKEPDKMLIEKDPIAMSLFNQYNQIAMPNLGLTQVDVMDLLRFMSKEYENKSNSKTHNQDSHDHKSHNNKQLKNIGDNLIFDNVWVREALPGAKINAGYMSIVNFSQESVNIVKVSSDAFESVEIHEMSMANGMMKMKHLDSLEIPAKDKIVLKPGGMHLMLINPFNTVFAGGEVELIVTFESGKTQILKLPILDK